MRYFLVCLLALSLPFVAACATEAVLSAKGYGAVRFGESLNRAEVALGEKPKVDEPGEACTYAQFGKYPGVKFMVEGGIITRADVLQAVPNDSGIKFGTPIAEALRLQPGLKMTPHKYSPDGHYLTLASSDEKFALVFETDKEKVTEVRGGLRPSVGYVEGCL